MKKTLLTILSTVLLLGACSQTTEPTANASAGAEANTPSGASGRATPTLNATMVVAGGCFWCVESDFEKLPAVGDVLSGYAGGDSQNPTYRSHADHLEVAQIPYDSSQVTYRELADYLLRHIDPLDAGGQFCDRGHSYTTALFYSTPDEKADAEAAIAQAASILKQPIATKVIELEQFWIAEDYHQDYYKKNPIRYKYYRNGCGRDKRVAQVWGEQ